MHKQFAAACHGAAKIRSSKKSRRKQFGDWVLAAGPSGGEEAD
jgi:hypothetical protein